MLTAAVDQTYPGDLPVPEDDGACKHLTGAAMPDLSLMIAKDPTKTVNLSKQPGLTIAFCYPRTAAPGETVPDSWNAIPGARGCTPQACSFRDSFSEIKRLGVSQVFGVSTQSPSYQAEVHERLHLPYDLLSDEDLRLQQALLLPTFDWDDGKLLKRVTLAIENSQILKVWYPVFPPDKSTEAVVAWLKERR
ncbi:uncharacterized protein HMPREF1541_02561 [Cyphellophora europaea CBS 101466]|uniref:Redoxin domain-containing protein n=1 Tax=Cyphellophora europaea (strain CBS 101466) TaxID=1220924 RepID=W2S407_CYPE1|nr:uncharacterized protein HMPREF1541_02561 [Cyphellophora europaea CBS 101466]ETN43402.1 hypothetical protein HMPREF1541_02561 [Cyphellophora europaea CBS 101466]